MSEENEWDRVEDFGWLKATPSPNWRKLTAAERTANAVTYGHLVEEGVAALVPPLPPSC